MFLTHPAVPEGQVLVPGSGSGLGPARLGWSTMSESTGPAGPLTAHLDDPDVGAADPEPVSYTHLDVYKRQGRGSRGVRRAAAGR